MKQLSNLQEFSVTDLSVSLKNTIEDKFSYIKLTGEISGFKKHSSGHCYFALKDDKSVIDAVMWKGNASKLNFPLKDGLEVCGTGKVTTYAGRSKYQIILDDLKPAGIGALMALLEELKKKLTDEGLFREDIKKPLPFLPKRIGIITSPTGAVIRDILHRLNDRFFPYTYVFPVAVQGDLSARQVSYALKFFNKCTEETPVKRPDVIIVARGGGYVEDLWSFNEEIVARSVAASQIPVISAVGHETDFTLCDFAADKRAPTPTAAAEMATPIKSDLIAYLESSQERIYSALSNLLQRRRDQHNLVTQKLPNILETIKSKKQDISTYNDKLSHNLKQNIWKQKNGYHNHRSLLRRSLIQNLVQSHQQKSDTVSARLEQSIKTLMHRHLQDINLKRQNLLNLSEKLYERTSLNIKKQKETLDFHHTLLKNMSYKSVLGRGYAVIHSKQGIITSKNDAKHHTPIEIEFIDGKYKI